MSLTLSTPKTEEPVSETQPTTPAFAEILRGMRQRIEAQFVKDYRQALLPSPVPTPTDEGQDA
jgi:hypothetical protein